MKKYLLPLILILCLIFAIPSYGADLYSTYDQRIKLTVDHDDIDSDLTPSFSGYYGDWVNIVSVRSGAEFQVYFNGVEKATRSDVDTDVWGTSNIFCIAVNPRVWGYRYNDKMDEVSLASTNRSVAWITAAYDSVEDTLLTYGEEETEGAAESGTHIYFTMGDF